MSENAPDRVIDRIRKKIQVNENGCWIWPAALNQGYGHIGWRENYKQFTRSTHRIIYEAEVGPIPEGMDLDHLCHDPAECAPLKASDCPHRACCNPEHLRPATRRENLLRGGTISAKRRSTTHCPAGHELDEANTLISKQGQRQCRACTYERNRAYYWKNRERRAAYNKAWRERQSR